MIYDLIFVLLFCLNQLFLNFLIQEIGCFKGF
jgi:hypothetical protein